MLQETEQEIVEHFYLTPTSFEKLGGVWPIRAGRTTAKPAYQVGPKWIECYSIHFIHEGNAALRYEDKEVRLNQGDLFVMYPNLVYQYRTTSQSPPLRMKWLAFQGTQAEALLASLGCHRLHPYLQQLVHAEVLDLLDQLFDLFPNPKSRNPLELGLEIQAMVYRIFARLAGRSSASEMPLGDAHWIEHCLDYIQTHFTEKITVESLAAYIGVNRSHLSSEFSRRVGVSPQRYIQNLRMTRGAWMLKETNRSVTEIAHSLGYPDLYGFNRAFRKHHGTNPSGFRNSCQH